MYERWAQEIIAQTTAINYARCAFRKMKKNNSIDPCQRLAADSIATSDTFAHSNERFSCINLLLSILFLILFLFACLPNFVYALNPILTSCPIELIFRAESWVKKILDISQFLNFNRNIWREKWRWVLNQCKWKSWINPNKWTRYPSLAERTIEIDAIAITLNLG